MQNILIVGAGLAGCTAARVLADIGHDVRLIEEKEHIAGNCYDEKQLSGITIHKYGPHIFHSKEKRVWDFLKRFTDFELYQHEVLSFAQGQHFPFPVNRDTLMQFFGVALSCEEVPAFLEKLVQQAKPEIPAQNFEDAVLAQVGTELYEAFYKPYTIKQWQRDPKDLSASLAGRIPVRSNRDPRYFTDRYQGIPRHGYTSMCQRMLEHPRINVQLETPYVQGMERAYDFLVYTGRLDEFFDFSEGSLEYRSVQFEFKTLDRAFYQEKAVVNYPSDYDFTRITEFKHMTMEESKRTEICLEYPSAEGVPCYVVPNEANAKIREAYMEKVKLLEEAKKAAFLGRLAEYKYYNMDQVVARVLDFFEVTA